MDEILHNLQEVIFQGGEENQLLEIIDDLEAVKQEDLDLFVQKSAEFIALFGESALFASGDLQGFITFCSALHGVSYVEWQRTRHKVKQHVKEILATLCIADKKSVLLAEFASLISSVSKSLCILLAPPYFPLVHSTFIWNPILDLLQRELIPEGIPAALVILKEMFNILIDSPINDLRSLDEFPEITYFLESTIQSIGPAFQGAVALLTGVYSVLSKRAPEAMKRNVKCIITTLFDQKSPPTVTEAYEILRCMYEDLMVGDILDEASFRNMPEEILKKIISQIIIILIHYPPSKIGEITEEEKKMSSLLDLIAVTAPSPCVSNIIFANRMIPLLITSSEWREVHASLVVLTVIAEGCRKRVLAELSFITLWISSCFLHEHPQVRFAACTALGQFCTDLAPDIQKRFSSEIVDTLLFGMEDEESDISTQATNAVINFFQDSDDISQAKRFLVTAMKKIDASNHDGAYFTAIFSAIGSILDSKIPKKELIEEFKEVIPKFMAILKASKDAPKDCTSTNALVAAITNFTKLESFAPYTSELISFLVEWQPDSELHFFNACLALPLEKDFLPWLSIILPRVISIENIKLTLERIPEETTEEWFGFLKDRCMTKSKGVLFLSRLCDVFPKRMIEVGINRCLRMISDYQTAFASKDVAADYINLFRGILALCCEDKKKIYYIVKVHENFLRSVLLTFLDGGTGISSFSSIVRSVDRPFLNGEQQDSVISLVKKSLCQFEKTKGANSSYVFDVLNLLDDCLERHPGMAKDCHSIWNFLQLCFDRFPDDTTLIEITIIIFDAFVAYCPSDLSYMWENQIPKVLALAQHPENNIRRSLVYGIGSMAECHTSIFNKHKKAMTDIILDSLKNETVTSVKDNAVFALGKIIQFQHSPVSINKKILDCWVNNLPSLDEAEACNKQLLYFLQSFPLEIGGKEGKKLENLWNNFVIMNDKSPAKGLAHEIIFELACRAPAELLERINKYSNNIK